MHVKSSPPFSTNVSSQDLAKRLLKEHVKPYTKLFSVACFFMILAAGATAALPYLLKPVFDDVFTKADPTLLVIFCGAVLGAFVMKGVASYGESVVMTYVGQKMISDIQNRLFRHLMNADLAFFHGTNSGDLLSRFTNDVNMMRTAMSNTIIGLGKDSLTLFFLISVMFYRDFTLALAAFFIFPIAILPIAKLGRRMRKVTYNTQEVLGEFTTQLSQTLQGIRVVKAYGMEEFEAKRAEGKIGQIFKLIYKTARVRSAAHPIIESLGGVAIIVVIAYGGYQVMNHTRTTGDFISFIAAMLLVYEPMKRLSNLNSNIQEGLAAASRVFQLLDISPTIVTPKTSVSLPKVDGKITFDHVNFQYPDGTYALKNISLTIEAAQTVALVGSSGAGKSTFINLIPRFYDVSSGSISIDGVDIRSFPLNELRHHMGLVSQEISLFDMSIRHNIAYGTQDASQKDIEEAARGAAAHDFICQLPQGYDTLVGENGVKLSGGQRQRIAIARAMLKNPKILLLDEATSALDTDSERQVQDALKTLMKGRTTLMVAHRLSTVVEADIIYVLNKGKIVEWGSHHDLLTQNGTYARLWQAQSRITVPS
jgi:subfamily B ATP-binding cassette protein MsbA